MNLPNMLTIFRMVLVPVFIVLMLLNMPLAALIVFAVASITDKLDGYLARKNNQVTVFGKFMDPLADKLLVMSAFLLFQHLGMMHVAFVFVILAREFIITSLRVLAIEAGIVMPAGISGKVKTAVQMVTLCLMLFVAWLKGTLVPGLPAELIYDICSWVMLAVTVWSGADYIWSQRALFDPKRK